MIFAASDGLSEQCRGTQMEVTTKSKTDVKFFGSMQEIMWDSMHVGNNQDSCEVSQTRAGGGNLLRMSLEPRNSTEWE